MKKAEKVDESASEANRPGRSERAIFSDKVLDAMARTGMSQSDLAALTGTDRGNLNEILNGKGDPRFSTIASVATALKIPLHELLNPRPKAPPPTGTRRIIQKSKPLSVIADK